MAPIEIQKRKEILRDWVNNKLSYRKLAKKYECSKSGVQHLITKFGEHATVYNLRRQNVKKGTTDPAKEQKVIQLLKAKKNHSVRYISRKGKVSVGTVQNIKKRNNIKTYKKQRIPKRSAAQQERARIRANKLYKTLVKKNKQCVLMDDETYVKMDLSTLPGPQFYNAVKGSKVPDANKSIRSEKFGPKILVWQAICSCGQRSSPYFTTGTINAENYREECLKKRLLPLYKKHDTPPVFWPDLASAHYAAATVNWMKLNKVDFIAKDENPPNCPFLRPIERYWAIIKRILRTNGKDIGSIEQFKRIWNSTSEKIDKELVQKLMGGIKRKVRQFSRG